MIRLTSIGCAAALAVLAPSAMAATAAPATAAGAVTFPRPTITVQAAETIANTCLDWYRAHPEVRGRPAVWVLNAAGDPIYMKRVDGASKIGVETGRMKANSALYLVGSTRSFQNFVRPRPDGSPNLTGVVLLQLLNAYTSIGGVPIVVDGQLLGAVGVGGMAPDMARDFVPDELCAQAGIDAVFPGSR